MSRLAARKNFRTSKFQAARSRRLQMESLEIRAMLAADISSVTFSPSVVNEGGNVTLTGSLNALPVTSGLQMWLDASDASSLVYDAAGKVEQWSDKSGLGNNATQSGNAAARPTYNTTALNGHAAIRFDGVDDGMMISNDLNVVAPFTIILVDQYYGATQGRTLQSRDANWLMGHWGQRDANYRGNWVFLPPANSAGINNPVISTAIGDTLASSSRYFINGGDVTGDPGPNGNPLRLGLVGGGQANEQSQADIAEIIVYNRVLTPAERSSVESYLAKKYELASVSTFTGADVGEGLDLDGNFLYAVNANGAAVGKIRDADFTADNAPGVTLAATQQIPNWVTMNLGSSAADDRLETVMQSIRWSDNPNTVNITLDSVVPGRDYKLQLLFAESNGTTARAFDIFVEGKRVLPTYDTGYYQQGSFTRGVAVTYEFTAGDSALNIVLDGRNAPAGLTDHNPILNGFTLEDLSPSFIGTTTVGSFTGGDAGEGLDLQGTFPYAVNARGPAAGAVGDANFTSDAAPGVTISAPNEILAWHAPNYGATTNDNNLEVVMQSIRWNSGPVAIDLANLTPGATYKLQLLYAEACCDRGFDLFVEGFKVLNDFNIPLNQGGINNTTRGAVITQTFVAPDSTLNISQRPGTPFPDNNPIINGLTLELIAPPVPPAPPAIAHNVTINWGDGSTPTALQLPTGVTTFNANHVYADNAPSGQPFGFYTPVVSVSDTNGNTDTTTSSVIGDPLVDRVNNDGASGYMFVILEPFREAGRVTSWSIFDNDTAGRQVTPLLVQRTGDNYVIRGVGATRTSDASGVQNFAFSLTSGSDFVGTDYYLAFKDGSVTADNAGVIDFANGSADGIRYFPAPHTNNLTIGRNIGAGTFSDRDYSIQATVVPTVQVNNVAPIAVFGGPSSFSEGTGTVQLSVSANDPAGALDSYTYAWDLDGDGIFGETGASATRGNEVGANPNFNRTGLNGPGTYNIAVIATDSDGATGPTTPAVITVVNAPPTLEIDGPPNTIPSYETFFSFIVSDHSSSDMAAGFTFDIDWGDGNVESGVVGSSLADIPHTYASNGTYTITAIAYDQDNAPSDEATFTVVVTPIAVIDGDLVVAGTDGADRIILSGSGGGTIRINNRPFPMPPFTGGIIVFGLAGNDTITVDGSVSSPVTLYGGEGADYLTGGKGDDTLDGGDGNDRLLGGNGNDVLIGGNGADRIAGGNGNDWAYGDDGNDLVQGDAGNDTLEGGAGNDNLVGGGGNDALFGNDGNDSLDGGAGADLLLGGQGNDKMYGRAGRDVLLGGSEVDTILGGTDEDLLVADTTSNDEDEFALAFIWATWSGGGSFDSRMSDLASYFDESTISDNDGFDSLTGEGSNDWFVYFQGDTLRDAKTGDFKQKIVLP